MQRPERSLSPWLLAVASVVSIPLIIALCITYVSVEDPVYIWDYRGYWSLFQNYGLLIHSGTEDWPQRVLDAIQNSDYNPSAVIPLYPFYRWFGGGRESYLISVSLLYLLPTVVIVTTLSLRTARDDGVSATALAFWAAITYLPFWGPTLRGMVDIVGLIFIGIGTLIMLRSDFLKRKPILNSLILGIVLWAPFLLRRWYAYSIVAFFVSSYIFGVVNRWDQSERRWREIFVFTLYLGITGTIVLAGILYFQWGLAERAITTSYSNLYEAYQIPFFDHFLHIQRRLGWYIVVIVAIGILSAIFTANIETLFCFSCALFTFFLFTHTQAMGPHHFLPIAFWLFPIYFAGLTISGRWLFFLPNAWRLAPFASASIVIFALGVSPALKKGGVLADFFLPREIYRPLQLENLREYRRLVSDLQADLKKEDRFVVWASSAILSDELLVTLEPALAAHYIAAPHIANQDLFRFEMLQAEYAVAVNPPQTHQAPGSQRNITIPGEMLLERVGFGSAFEKVDIYALAKGATGVLYRRQRSVSVAEVKDVMERLVVAYPDWRGKFQKTMSLPFAGREVVLGDIWGRVEVQGNTTMFLHPGATQPTSVSLRLSQNLDERPASVKFMMDDKLEQCLEADGTTLAVAMDNIVVWKGDLVPGGAARAPIPKSGQIMSIIVDKKHQPNCDHVSAMFEF